MTDNDHPASGGHRQVVAAPYGERYHRFRPGMRLKHAACGGFNQTNLFRLPESEALEQGYTRCENCDWETGG